MDPAPLEAAAVEAAPVETPPLDAAPLGARGRTAQNDRIPPDSLKNEAQNGRLAQ